MIGVAIALIVVSFVAMVAMVYNRAIRSAGSKRPN